MKCKKCLGISKQEGIVCKWCSSTGLQLVHKPTHFTNEELRTAECVAVRIAIDDKVR